MRMLGKRRGRKNALIRKQAAGKQQKKYEREREKRKEEWEKERGREGRRKGGNQCSNIITIYVHSMTNLTRLLPRFPPPYDRAIAGSAMKGSKLGARD